MTYFDEAKLEITAVDWLMELGFNYTYGPKIEGEYA